jgi:hypothetical protein
VSGSLLAVLVAASSVETAIDALQHDDSLKVRTQAAIVLGQRGAQAAIPALRQAITNDDSAAVRIAAVGALAKLRARAARPTIQACIESDPEPTVRAAAKKALAALGSASVRLEEPTGTASARDPVRNALTARLQDLGFSVADSGEIRLKPKVAVDVTEDGGRTVISAKVAVTVIDADNHLDMVDGNARAAVNGTLPEPRLTATSAKVVEAAVQGLSQNLATKLGGR